MGYGITLTSLFVAFGVNPVSASATVHCTEGVVDLVSAFSHLKLGNVEKSMLVQLLILGSVGACLGAISLSFISLKIAKSYISGILLLMGGLLLYRHVVKRTEKKLKSLFVGGRLPLLAFIAAFIDVSGGGGWGPICTPTFILNGVEPKKAVGTVEFTEPIISWVAIITFVITVGFTSFLWSLFCPLVIGGFVLTPIAAYLCKKIPKKWLGILIGVWIIVINLNTIISTWFNP